MKHKLGRCVLAIALLPFFAVVSVLAAELPPQVVARQQAQAKFAQEVIAAIRHCDGSDECLKSMMNDLHEALKEKAAKEHGEELRRAIETFTRVTSLTYAFNFARGEINVELEKAKEFNPSRVKDWNDASIHLNEVQYAISRATRPKD